VGAAVCVYLDGVRVVDCWGGHADAARTRPFGADTIVSVASTTKGMVALCAHMLAERGKLDLDAPVARYWPEFAAAGKQDIPVRWLLSHRAGLPAIRPSLSAAALFDWTAMTAAIAETAPWWTPGERHGYHAITYGHLVGEVIRRVDGRTVGALLRDDVTGPLRADFFIGVPEEADGRAAEVLPPPPPGEPTIWDTLLADPESVSGRTFLNPPRVPGLVNTRAWRAAEIPAANGHTSARGVARVYAALARGGELDGVRLLAPATIERAIEEQSRGRDAVLTLPTRFATGFMLGMPGGIFDCGPGRRTFGHPGHGGSIGFADPDARVAFGYVTNQYVTGTAQHPDRRVPSLVDAVYAALR
jgi:CubicO group peptidase (beta-lactamase class C family)